MATLARTSPTLRQRRVSRHFIPTMIIYLILSIGSIICLAPFAWMLSSSLKPEYEVFLFPPKWIPDPWMWSNYITAVQALKFEVYMRNTLIIAFFNILGHIFSCTLAAYAFARLKAPGREFLFLVVLSTMMLPGVVTMIPVFILFRSLDWINTFYPLIVPAWFGSAFFIFLLRQFFMTIPVELEEAARIDGANRLQILYFVMLPLVIPAIATMAIFNFQGVWNDFQGPLIYLNRQELWTLTLALNGLKSEYTVPWNLLMAGSVLLVLPLILLFFFAQRYFIEGISLTGLKG